MNRNICQDYFPGRSQLFKSVDHSKYKYVSQETLVQAQMRFLTEIVYAMYTQTTKNDPGNGKN